jgi:hypothetical protein
VIVCRYHHTASSPPANAVAAATSPTFTQPFGSPACAWDSAEPKDSKEFGISLETPVYPKSCAFAVLLARDTHQLDARPSKMATNSWEELNFDFCI